MRLKWGLIYDKIYEQSIAKIVDAGNVLKCVSL